MKQILLFILFLFGYLSGNAQFHYFNNRYNNDNWSYGVSILETKSGYIISGVSGVVSQGNIFNRIVLTAIDVDGNQLWWKTYGEDFHNYYAGNMRSTDKTWDDGFVVGGSVEDTIGIVGLLIKFDQNGDSLWSKIYTGTIINLCRELPDHGFVLAGSTYVSGDDVDIILIKTDSIGNTIWSHTYGLEHIWEESYSIAQLPNGGFIVGFQKTDLNWLYSGDPGILEVDSLGNQIWMKYYGSTMDEWGSAVALSQDGNYLFGTTYAMSEPGPGDPLLKARIIKTDTTGNIIWDKKYSNHYFGGNSCTIDELNDGSIILSGTGAFDDSFNYQGWIIKVKPNGDSIWMRRYDYYYLNNGYLNDLYDIHITNDNGIILTGYVFGDPEWEQSIWVQKLDSIGCDSVRCDTTVDISDEHGGMEALGYGNLKIWPNPASDWIHIIFRDNKPNLFSERQLQIFNVFGENVIEVKIPHWTETYDYNVTNLSQGLYLLIIRDRQRVVYSGKFLIER